MPQAIVAYVLGLLQVAGRATCTRLSRNLACVSHDTLTRTLQRVSLQGQTLLLKLARRLFGDLTRGYLILDDTVVEKAFAKCIPCLGWMYSSKRQRTVLGLCVVALMWSNGTITFPVAFRLWKPGGKTRIDLALELLRWARKHRLQPRYVLFDSFFSAKQIFKLCQRYRWHFVSQVKRNRKFNGQQVRRFRRHPYWSAVGTIDGGLSVRIAKHGKKYFVTSRISLTSATMRAVYKKRWGIEEAFRLLHDQLNLDTCQARSEGAQENHLRLCCTAYLVLVSEAERKHITPYQLKENVVAQRERWNIQYVERILSSA